MKRDRTFLVAGGDRRQIYTARKLAEENKVYITGFTGDEKKRDTGKAIQIDETAEMKEKADCLILPLPITSDNIFLHTPCSEKKIPLAALKSAVNEDGIIAGGRVTEQVLKIFGNVYDYSKREDFAVMNAVPTAEAAVEIAMKATEKTLYKSSVLIIGAGRISKALARILSGFGAKVTIAARKKSDLLWAEIYGYRSAEISCPEAVVTDADIIFNTAPAPILKSSLIDLLKPTAVIVDLASAPGGTDFEHARKRNIKAFLSLSLPGKYSPVTAGEITAQTILNILTERRYPE